MGRDRIDRLNLPTPPSLFVSYSRAQLAIAESLAVSAAANGIAVWFDLLALTPGLDWQLAIDAGLDAATWVALVVSRESLASPNVAREVERALSSGKPLYLLVVDDCPLRLRHVPGCNLEVEARGIIDFRYNFHAAFARLTNALTASHVVRDPIAREPFWALPLRLPRPIVETALAFAVPIAAILVEVTVDLATARALWTRGRRSNGFSGTRRRIVSSSSSAPSTFPAISCRCCRACSISSCAIGRCTRSETSLTPPVDWKERSCSTRATCVRTASPVSWRPTASSRRPCRSGSSPVRG